MLRGGDLRLLLLEQRQRRLLFRLGLCRAAFELRKLVGLR
jgi:hypothetical protein